MANKPHVKASFKATESYASITKNPLNWLEDRLPIISLMKHSTTEYPAPKNLNYMWNFGSLAMFALLLQIATGLFLTMHYKPDINHAFDSVQHIIRDVNWGWLVRNLHMVGASFFFIVVYIHIGRGLYYGSYKAPREVLWWIGVVILLAMMATAFLGYVLPWGQMSYWGATVITNLFSAIPLIGQDIVVWLWGGFSVGDATLNRFFAFHYLLPFIILGFVGLHLWALHQVKSNNPVGIDLKKDTDYIPLHPYYTIKDVFGLAIYLLPFLFMVFYHPDALGHPDNYIPADPMKTPPHIVPEWYFLPFYAILRSITFNIGIPFTDIVFVEAKLLGVLAMGGAIVILMALPWLDRSKVRSARFRPVFRAMLLLWLVNVAVLGWVGANPPEGIFPIIGLVSTIIYFGFFAALPFVTKREKTLKLPTSI